MVALDLETTAADPETARIVQVAIAYVGGGAATESWSTLVDPGVEIPQEATEIHGISTEQARAEGVPTLTAIVEILKAFVLALDHGWPLVVFNAPYDLTVVAREATRCGVDPLTAGPWVVDPLVIDRHLQMYRPGSRKLIDACKHYGARLDGAHDATFDVIAAARLAWVLGRRGDVVRRTRGPEEAAELARLRREWFLVRGDLRLLHDAQRRWATRGQAELQEYFRKGNPGKGVPPQPDRMVPIGWPMYS